MRSMVEGSQMLKDIAPKAQSGAVAKARRLRRAMTLPEVLLWQASRRQSTGLEFRRQHASGPYILDFYCSDARLAIEVDGEAHNRGNRPQLDQARYDWFGDAGVATMRLPATAVLADADAVVRGIIATARERLPLHHPGLRRDGPPPRGKLEEE